MLTDFAKEKIYWTKKMNLRLVKYIEKKPHIWNPRHAKYSNTAAKDKTYAYFAAKYGYDFSGEAVKNRWTNIRSTFAHHLRKVTSKGAGKKKTIIWPLWEPCQFLLQVNKKTTSSQSLIDIKTEEEYGNELEGSSADQDKSDDGSYDSTHFSDSVCNTLAQNIVDVYQKIQNGGFVTNRSENEHVGWVITEKLSQLPSSEAAQLTHCISAILLRYPKPDSPES